jgi:hypothetical protein
MARTKAELGQGARLADYLSVSLLARVLTAQRVLRSKTAALVRQGFYGCVLAHYAVRWLLHQGAARSGHADDDLSFTAHIQLLQRERPRSGAFSPTAPQKTQPLVATGAARKRQAALRAHP